VAALPAAVAAWYTAATAMTVFKVIVTAALMVNGVMQARRQRKQAKAAWEASLKDRTLTIRSAVQPRTIVYGRARVGGVMIRKPITSGSYSEYLHIQLALGGHEFDEIEEIYFDDSGIGTWPSGFDANGWVTGGRYVKSRTHQGYQSVVVGPFSSGDVALPSGATYISVYADGGDNGYLPVAYTRAGDTITITNSGAGYLTVGVSYRYTTTTPYVRVKKFLGTTAGERDTDLESVSGGVWKPTHLGKGVPRIHVTLLYDPDMFPSGLPQITVLARGKKLYDERTGTTVWSNNSALCTRDYIADPLGLGESASYIGAAAAPANVCEEWVPLAGGGQQRRYTCDGVLSTADNRLDNLGAILTSMVGTAVYSGGQWIISAGAYSSPVMDLTDADLADGPIELITETPTRDLFNAVRGKIIDAERRYQEVDVPPYVSSVYVTEDGDTFFQDITLPMTDNVVRAQRIQKLILHLSRQSVGLSAWWKDKAARLRPGDVIRVTIDLFGQVSKTYRVIDRKFQFPRGVHLVLQETGSAPYSWNYTEAIGYDPTPNTSLPDPRDVTEPANLAVSTVLKRRSDGVWQIGLKATWNESTDIAVRNGGEIIVEATHAVTGAKITSKVSGDSTEAIIAEAVGDREVYHVRAQAYNGLARSDWAYADAFTVTGPEDPPEPPTVFQAATESFGVRLSWVKSSSFDVIEYQIREGASWDTGTPVATVTGTSFFWQPQTAGTKTYWIKAIDAWGNASSAVSASVTSTIPAVSGLALSVDGDSALIVWGAPAASYQIEDYEIRVGASYASATVLGLSKSTMYRTRVSGSGVVRYWVAARDVAGNLGTETSVELIVSLPATPVISVEVVDNFALLRWQDCKTTLPVERYEVYRDAQLVGDNGDGRFAVLFEQAAGDYRYGVVANDSAGNASVMGVVTARVNAPPDYVLRDEFYSDFSGTKTNAYTVDGGLIAPVFVETDAEHTTRIGVSTDSAAAGLGFDKWWEPGQTSASYREVFDIGVTVDPSTITVTPTLIEVQGVVAVTCTVETSGTGAFAGEQQTYTGTSVYAGGTFRYVRVTLTFASTGGDDLVHITQLKVKISTKLRTEAGVVNVTVNPTTVNTSGEIDEILAIVITPKSTQPRQFAYDYTSGTSFDLYLFDKDGNPVTGDVSWTVRGV